MQRHRIPQVQKKKAIALLRCINELYVVGFSIAFLPDVKNSTRIFLLHFIHTAHMLSRLLRKKKPLFTLGDYNTKASGAEQTTETNNPN